MKALVKQHQRNYDNWMSFGSNVMYQNVKSRIQSRAVHVPYVLHVVKQNELAEQPYHTRYDKEVCTS